MMFELRFRVFLRFISPEHDKPFSGLNLGDRRCPMERVGPGPAGHGSIARLTLGQAPSLSRCSRP